MKKQRKQKGLSMPTWLPSGATGHSDFGAGQHYWGGAERAVTDILGGGFDPGSISSNGMRLEEASGGNKPEAIGPLLAALVGHGVGVVEYKDDASSQGGHTLIGAYDAPDRQGGGFEVFFYKDSGSITGGANAYSTSGSGNADEAEPAGVSGDVIRTLFVHDVGLVAVSSQGHPVVAGNHSLIIPTRTVVYLGHVGEGATSALSGWIRKITVWPALTAL